MAPRQFPTDSDRWRHVEQLAGDVSTRRYSRLQNGAGGSVILAEYPVGERRALVRDLEVLAWARGRGLRVPELIDHDLADGWALLEDFGPADAAQVLRTTAAERRPELLGRALVPLVVIAGIDPQQLPPFNPPLAADRLRWELAGFELWFLNHLKSQPPPPDVASWLDRLAEDIAAQPTRVCHRDYHLNNLFLLDNGEVGIIDIQDILVGPDTYDAVSLLAERDTPRLVDRTTRQLCMERWAESTGAAAGWLERSRAVRLQRGLKVLGTFARLTVSGRTGYRCWLEAQVRALIAEADLLGLPPHVAALLLD
jgi:aminoglycoside/choline kinase family phosphotransferase